MRPLRPEEREEILAMHPDATEEDLEEFEALVSERFSRPPEPEEREEPERTVRAARRTAQAEARRAAQAEARLEAMQHKLFPRFEEAMQRAKARRSQRKSGA
jgi:hypothetical protein